jgi:hypothetical protein
MRVNVASCTLSMLAVLTAGCGTTVSQASSHEIAGDFGDGTSSGLDGGTGIQRSVPNRSAGGTQAPDGASGDPQVVSGSGGGSGSTTSGPTSTARPVTGGVLSPVKVGVVVPDTSAKADASALGLSLDFGDPRAMVKAMGDWVNANGGLQGHPISLVVDQDGATSTIAQNDSAHCATFTQDNHVAAVVTSTVNGVGLPKCLGRAGAGLFGSGVTVLRSDDLRHAGAQWSPYMLNGERLFTQLLVRLKATGWLATGERIGILYTDDGTTFTPLAQMVKAKAQAMGVPITDMAGVATGDNSANANAVLKFQSQRITRVIAVGLGARLQIDFSTFAKSQQYYPRYSFTSVDVPGTAQSLMDPQTLKGAAGIGWVPTSDLAAAQLPPPNPARRLCQQIYAKAGVNTSTPLAVALADSYCDGFMFLHAVHKRAADLTLAAARQAIVAMGTGYTSAVTSATSWGAGNFDGAAQTHDLAYSSSCPCFVYTKTAPATVPS